MTKLVNRNSKFAIDVAGRNFIITASHNMRVQTNAYRVRITVSVTKLLKNRNIVNINDHAKLFTCFDFFKIYAVWCEQNFFWFETRLQSQFNLIDTYAVKTGANLLHQL